MMPPAIPPPARSARTVPQLNRPMQTSATTMMTASARRPRAAGLIRSVKIARAAGGTWVGVVSAIITASPCDGRPAVWFDTIILISDFTRGATRAAPAAADRPPGEALRQRPRAGRPELRGSTRRAVRFRRPQRRRQDDDDAH